MLLCIQKSLLITIWKMYTRDVHSRLRGRGDYVWFVDVRKKVNFFRWKIQNVWPTLCHPHPHTPVPIIPRFSLLCRFTSECYTHITRIWLKSNRFQVCSWCLLVQWSWCCRTSPPECTTRPSPRQTTTSAATEPESIPSVRGLRQGT